VQELSKTLINACGAKTAGARTILRQLLKSLPPGNFVVACPNSEEFRLKYPLVQFIEVETSGFASFRFTILDAATLAKSHGCTTIVSLMNFNVISKRFHKLTYFHQAKALFGNKPKERVQRLMLKMTSKGDTKIICQTPYIAECLKRNFPALTIQEFWPGFELIEQKMPAAKKESQLVFLLPSSSSAAHKNIASILEQEKFFTELGAKLIITGQPLEKSAPPFHFLPLVSKEKLAELYQIADAIIFPSLEETVALPVFEALALGKPVFIKQSGYTFGLFDRFLPLQNLHLYSVSFAPALREWLDRKSPCAPPRPDLAEGNWEWLATDMRDTQI